MNDELDPTRLQRLLDDVARLPRAVDPPAGAWDAIRARIDAQRVRPIAGATPGTATHRRPARWWWVATAAAAGLLVFIGGSSMVAKRSKARAVERLAAQREATPGPVGPVGPAAAAAAEGGSVAVPTPVSLSTTNPALAATIDGYQKAVRDLDAGITRHLEALTPGTREVVRRSLATIDTAIAELRTALDADPRDAALGRSLAGIYETKLDFLRRVRALPAAGM